MDSQSFAAGRFLGGNGQPSSRSNIAAQTAQTKRVQQARQHSLAAARGGSAKTTHLLRSTFTGGATAFELQLKAKKRTVLPLSMHHAEGDLRCHQGLVAINEDGYYLALWELDLRECSGAARMVLGIDDAGSIVIHELRTGYDSGQQILFLNRGNQICLRIEPENEAHLQGNAKLVLLHLG